MQKPFRQRQHYVPEAYLKGFTEAGKGFFHELRISDFRTKEQHIGNVCFGTNFYDISHEALLYQFSIRSRPLEKSFAYERTLPALLMCIKNRVPYLVRREFEVIVEGYVSIKHRTPFARKQFGELQTHANGKMIDDLANSLKLDIQKILALRPDFNYDAVVANFKQSILQDKDLAAKSHHRSLVEISKDTNEAFKDALAKILTMNITIIESNDPHSYFLVSDNPGYSVKERDILCNTNYGDFDMILFPINSKQAILLHGFDRINYIKHLRRLQYVKVNATAVEEVNLNTFQMAHERVFCENRHYLERLKLRL